MSRRVAVLAVSLAAAGALLAGCGSSAPTKAQYTAKANAICAAASSKTAPLIGQLTSAAESLSSGGGQSAARQLTSSLQQLYATGTSTLAKLRALKQPSAGHAAIERFLTPFASVNGALGEAAAAAAAGQPQKALPELQTVEPGSQQMASAAKAYGLTKCESVLSVL